jgi:hypothetical protein
MANQATTNLPPTPHGYAVVTRAGGIRKGEAMKIEAGKYYKMRNGGKAFVEHVYRDSPFSGKIEHVYPVSGFRDGIGIGTWTMEGRYQNSGNDSCDLIEEWREPVTKEVTVYLYADGFTATFPGAEKPIASARVTLKEGEFV